LKEKRVFKRWNLISERNKMNNNKITKTKLTKIYRATSSVATEFNNDVFNKPSPYTYLISRPTNTTLFNVLRRALRANPNLVSVYYADTDGYFYQASSDIKQDPNPNNTNPYSWSYVLGKKNVVYVRLCMLLCLFVCFACVCVCVCVCYFVKQVYKTRS
jgi:hypothetical protein